MGKKKQLNEYEPSASKAGAGGDTQNILALSSFGGGAGPGSQTDLVSWGGGDGAMAGSDEGAMQLRPYNQRIELPNVDDSDGEGGKGGGGGAGGGGGSGDDDGIHDLDEDELTRDKVKKAASHVRSFPGVHFHGVIVAYLPSHACFRFLGSGAFGLECPVREDPNLGAPPFA